MVKVIKTEFNNGNVRFDLETNGQTRPSMFGDVSFSSGRLLGQPEVSAPSLNTNNPALVRAMANALLQAADILEAYIAITARAAKND